MPPPYRISFHRFLSQSPRAYSTRAPPIIRIPKANIYPFGAHPSTRPSLQSVEWTVKEGEAWAVVSRSRGGGGKSVLFQTLLGNTRISPPPPSPGLYPFLNGLDPFDGRRLGFVAFRNMGARGAGGGFYDYTARYGAVREEDGRTLRDSLDGEGGKVEELVDKLGLKDLMDLPLIALSNGQTRRARIARAVMKAPEVLLLDEPLTGLDPTSRTHLLALLQDLHASRSPRIIIGMRAQEELPGWVTHVLDVGEGGVIPMTRERWRGLQRAEEKGKEGRDESKERVVEGELVVDLKGVGVKYGNRIVLKDITWQIREGERWHLQGSNGSGKTTLLSLLTGDHPQSYTQAHLHLPSLSPASSSSPSSSSSTTHPYRTHTLHPRKRTPTAHLRTLIGVVSPELFDAFPRRHPGMTVWEAVVTGFGGGFVPLKGSERVGEIRVGDEELGFEVGEPSEVEKEERRREVEKWRISRWWEVLAALGPRAWSTAGTPDVEREFAARRFTALSPGEQRIVLLMRALVSRPPLVLLDEVWSGVDEGMICAVRKYLTKGGGVGEEQTVVVITHWDEEVPWGGEGVRRYRIWEGVRGVV